MGEYFMGYDNHWNEKSGWASQTWQAVEDWLYWVDRGYRF